MNNFLKSYVYPLLVLIIGGLFLKFLNLYLTMTNKALIIAIVLALLCFAFGISLFPYKRSKGWIKKMLVVFIFVFLLYWDLGYLHFKQVQDVISLLGINDLIFKLLYVYLGWTFFE